MGIIAEFTPDLRLRNISEFNKGNRKIEECIPEDLVVGKTYPFLKLGQRHYWLEGEIPLLETDGGENYSRPLASVIILETTHFIDQEKIFTKGFYKVVEVFHDDKIHFEGLDKIGKTE